jgi:hypothetical protein
VEDTDLFAAQELLWCAEHLVLKTYGSQQVCAAVRSDPVLQEISTWKEKDLEILDSKLQAPDRL